MLQLPYTSDNVTLVQEFLDETKKRISQGIEVTYSLKASRELGDLALTYDIETDDILDAIENLTTENYYRGIDPSFRGDFDLCVFCTTVGKENIEIYLKYGLQVNGLEILLISCHVPDFPMSQPFKN
ncbi:hypothetical protein [Flavobacterium chilense]|uniref:Uncharacterized protein n=1 Tax=Flavobacterium chilense TaxID=946677 RepID=A0A1M7HPX6_9FLAO|nr:hypothetical protein [Flavobacterium chilense]SHM30556.1 hypothetical protein SAMN05444484_10573 [Flavobacterium chilense]